MKNLSLWMAISFEVGSMELKKGLKWWVYGKKEKKNHLKMGLSGWFVHLMWMYPDLKCNEVFHSSLMYTQNHIIDICFTNGSHAMVKFHKLRKMLLRGSEKKWKWKLFDAIGLSTSKTQKGRGILKIDFGRNVPWRIWKMTHWVFFFFKEKVSHSKTNCMILGQIYFQ